jgi:hypothetical protein
VQLDCLHCALYDSEAQYSEHQPEHERNPKIQHDRNG